MQANGTEHLIDRDDAEDVIDLSHYLRVIIQAKWRILGLSFFITLLAVLIALSMTPIYRATSSLLIEAEETNVVSIEQVYGIDSSRQEYFETQFEILKSRHIAERVVEKLSLLDNPIFQSHFDSESKFDISSILSIIKELLPFLPQSDVPSYTQDELDLQFKEQVIDLFIENLSISPVTNTQVVKISFLSESPKLSAQISNTVAEVYIENYLEAKFEMTSRATAWLNDSLQGLKSRLELSEGKLGDFYEREQLVDLDGVVGLASEELQGLSEQLLTAENRLKQNEIIYEQVQNFDGDIDELAKIPEVLNHPSIQNVRESELDAERAFSELSKVYGPKHQKMISASAELLSIQETLNRQVRALVSGITSEYRQVELQVERLRASVEVAKQEFRKLTTLDSQRKTLQREVDINQQLYNSFFTRLKETSEVQGFETANARILDEATIPADAAKPNKALIVIGAFVLSLGFGVFVAIALDFLSSGIRSTDDIERKLGQRMMGLIPWQPHKKKEHLALREFFNTQNHTFAESIRTLRTSLQLLDLTGERNAVMITSSVPKEGKTTVSINLAFALGQLGKTILIDGDLRKPSIATRFEIPNFQPGLSNVIAGTHSFQECLISDPASGIDLLTAGPVSPNPQEMLMSQKFKDLISSLKQSYDHVVIDTAPTQAVSDAIIVSDTCDSLLYVVKADATSDKLISNGLMRFMQVGKRIDGVVLNQVDIKKAGTNYAYTGYYDAYGYGVNENNSA